MDSVLDREEFDQSVGKLMEAGIPFSLFMIRIFVMKRSDRLIEKQCAAETLELTVKALQKSLRRTDLIGVYGNGELVVALKSGGKSVGTDRASHTVWERLKAMETERDCSIHVLTGAARWFKGEEFETIYERAIRNLSSCSFE